MTPIKYAHCNDVLRAPEGDDNCEDLHICREDGQVWSFWTPNAEELAAIVKGGEIALRVQGATHPPLSLHVMSPGMQARAGQVTDPEEIKAIFAANTARCQAMLSIAKRAIAELVTATGNQHEALVNEFLDLITLNQCEGEVVRELKGGGA